MRSTAADERADDQVGHRRAQAGDIVVAGPGRVVRRAGARAARDVVEVRRVLVQDVHHLLRARAVERRLVVQGAALVGDRQERRPLRCPALVPPTSTQPKVVPRRGRSRRRRTPVDGDAS